MGRPKGSKNKVHIQRERIICPTCAKIFYVYPSVLRRKKRGNQINKYCSRDCADRNRKNVWRMFGPDTNNYKNGESSYRENAIKAKGLICELCGYNGNAFPQLIWVHHKDFAKRNPERDNGLNNLEVLCIRCHMEKHLALGKAHKGEADAI